MNRTWLNTHICQLIESTFITKENVTGVGRRAIMQSQMQAPRQMMPRIVQMAIAHPVEYLIASVDFQESKLLQSFPKRHKTCDMHVSNQYLITLIKNQL